MYGYNDPKRNTNRQYNEAATQRKATNDTQYFWDLVNRHMNGQHVGPMKRMNKAHEEHQLFAQKAEQASTGFIDDSIPVERSGPRSEDIQSLDSFQHLNGMVPSYISRCIELLRYEKPTPIQKHSIPLGLAGLDLMCCAQTGSGKTFAFLVPVIAGLDPQFLRKKTSSMTLTSSTSFDDNTTLPANSISSNTNEADSFITIDQRGVLPRAIVLAPTRELASQIQLDARRLTFNSNIKTVCVYGGNDIRTQLQEMCTGCELIVATPGRLNDLVDRGCVSLANVNFLVLDEADRMLDMGFEPQIRKIVLEYDMPRGEKRQTFMFSATFPTEIQKLAREFLRNYVWIAVGRVGSTVENIKQQVLMASADPSKKLELLLDVINQTDGRTLIFVQKKKTASWVCECLRSMYGVTAEEIHGDRSQSQREYALKMFRDGQIRILVATDVAARGLDVPQVMHVVQFDMPLSAEDFDVYVHRIGRTGRAGMSGLATSFFVPGRDVGEGNGRVAQPLMTLLQENNQEVPDWLANGEGGGYGGGYRNKFGGGAGAGGYANKPQGKFGFSDSRGNQYASTMYQQSGHQQQGGGGYNPRGAPSMGGGGGYHNNNKNMMNRPAYGNNAAVQGYATSAQSHTGYYQGQQQGQGVASGMTGYGQYNPAAAAGATSGGGSAAVMPPMVPTLNVSTTGAMAASTNATTATTSTTTAASGSTTMMTNPSFTGAGYFDPYSGTYIPGNPPLPQAPVITTPTSIATNNSGADALNAQFNMMSMGGAAQQGGQQQYGNMKQAYGGAPGTVGGYQQGYQQKQAAAYGGAAPAMNGYGNVGGYGGQQAQQQQQQRAAYGNNNGNNYQQQQGRYGGNNAGGYQQQQQPMYGHQQQAAYCQQPQQQAYGSGGGGYAATAATEGGYHTAGMTMQQQGGGGGGYYTANNGYQQQQQPQGGYAASAGGNNYVASAAAPSAGGGEQQVAPPAAGTA